MFLFKLVGLRMDPENKSQILVDMQRRRTLRNQLRLPVMKAAVVVVVQKVVKELLEDLLMTNNRIS